MLLVFCNWQLDVFVDSRVSPPLFHIASLHFSLFYFDLLIYYYNKNLMADFDQVWNSVYIKWDININ